MYCCVERAGNGFLREERLAELMVRGSSPSWNREARKREHEAAGNILLTEPDKGECLCSVLFLLIQSWTPVH